MTHYILTIAHYLQSPVNELLTLISEIYSTARSNYAKHKAYKSTIKELGRLTDYQLLDMGLSRYDIHELARQTAYGNTK
jgi:uncharacterized protein YjiS (DUF1127 family)